MKRFKSHIEEATAMTAGPKGSLGGIGKKPSMPAPGDSKRTINAPKGTARHHAEMAAKHQQSAQHHERRASEHEDEGNDDRADHHYGKMQHHDNAADAHKHAQDMIKKHGADHPEAQKASKEANKHKLGESVELDEGLAGAAVGGAGGAALGYKKFGTLGGIAGGIIGAAGGSGVEDGYKSTRKKKKNEEAEQIDEISADLAKRALDKRDAQANKLGSAAKRATALKNRSLDKGRQRRDREMGTNMRKDAEIKKHTDTAKRAGDVGSKLHRAARKADKKADKTYDYMKKRGMKTESAEQIDEISKELAGRYLKKAPARAADAGEKIARASQAYDRKSGDAQRKKGIRTFLNVHKGVERATNRLMKKESAIDEVSSEKLADYANKAINDRAKAKRDAERASDSAGANRFRGDNKAAERDDAKAANAKDRVRRRNRGAGLYTRKMLTKKEDQSE